MHSPRLAYVAQGRLHLHAGDSAPRVVESAFGRSLRERAAEIQNRNAWKTQGFGAKFMGLSGRARPELPAGDFPILLTSVARGSAPGEVFYSLETREISGVFAVDASGFERRLFHTADFRVRDPAVHPDGSAIAVSVSQGAMAANIAVLKGDGSDFRDVSEGDSVDQAPHWNPGPQRQLVFQSAGLGRDASGRLSGRGPFTVQQLDLETGELRCLAEDPGADYLGPQVAPDGDLYYIRRPYGTRTPNAGPLAALKDAALLPFDLVIGILKLLSFAATLSRGGKRPWASPDESNNPAEQFRVFGETVAISRAEREERKDAGEVPSLVPSTWQLIRQTPAGQRVLGSGIVSFDIAPDGSVLYSNGRSVHRVDPDGVRTERVHVGNLIQQVAAL